jgi:hypothetical protein
MVQAADYASETMSRGCNNKCHFEHWENLLKTKDTKATLRIHSRSFVSLGLAVPMNGIFERGIDRTAHRCEVFYIMTNAQENQRADFRGSLKILLTSSGLLGLQSFVDRNGSVLFDRNHLLHGFVARERDIDDVVAGVQQEFHRRILI